MVSFDGFWNKEVIEAADKKTHTPEETITLAGPLAGRYL